MSFHPAARRMSSSAFAKSVGAEVPAAAPATMTTAMRTTMTTMSRRTSPAVLLLLWICLAMVPHPSRSMVLPQMMSFRSASLPGWSASQNGRDLRYYHHPVVVGPATTTTTTARFASTVGRDSEMTASNVTDDDNDYFANGVSDGDFDSIPSSSSSSKSYKKKTRPVTAMLDDLMNDHVDTGEDDEEDDPLQVLEWKQKELSTSLGTLKKSLEEEKERSEALKARLAEAERIIEEQNRKLERATRSQFQELEALEAELKAQRQREQDKVKQEREQRLMQEALLEQTQAVAREQQRALTEQVQKLQAELEAAMRESNGSKKEVDQVARELSSARNEISSLANRLQNAQSKEGTYQTKMSKLEEKLNMARDRLATKQQILARTQRDLAQAQSMLDLQGKLSGNDGGSNNNNNKSPLDPSSIFSGSLWSPATGNSNAAASPKPAPKKPIIKQIPPPTPVKTFVYPFINDWSIVPTTGEVTGTVRNHPDIPDGTKIVTSALANPRMALANAVVVTKSGTKYQLGMPSRVLDAKKNTSSSGDGRPAAAVAPPAKQASTLPGSGSNNNLISPLNFFSGIAGGMDVGKNPAPAAQSPQQQQQQQQQQTPASAPQFSQSQQQQQQQLAFPLTGESISNGRGTKYLLAGRAKRKPSGRSEIIMAYQADEDLQPTGDPLVVKLSTHKHKLEAEYANYEKIQPRGGMGGLLGGGGPNSQQQPFVKCIDYLPRIEGSIKYAQHSALILEQGEIDLREYRGGSATGPYPPALIKAALSTAVRCMDTMHKARLVYTDIKAENFIIMDTSQLDGEPNNIVIKGVDLESAVPHRGNPIDYTPEASPPEFAVAFLEGVAHEFVLDYSYDVWSFGMLAYELATGKGHFGKKPPAQIIKNLGTVYFEPPKVDGSAVADDKLRDLIQRCLSMDPKKRPTTSQIANHPYFRGDGVAMPRLFGW